MPSRETCWTCFRKAPPMPLKKPRMSLAEAREASFKVESQRGRPARSEPADLPANASDQPASAAPPEPAADAPATIPDLPTTPAGFTAPALAPADTETAAPDSSEEPAASPKPQSPSERGAQMQQTAEVKADRPAAPKSPTRRARPATDGATTDNADETKPTTMFVGKAPPGAGAIIPVSAPTPSPGVSATFDALCETRSPSEAIQALLKKALTEYEAMLVDGSFKAAPASYRTDDAEVRKGEIWIRRKLSQKALQAARTHFDPFELDAARPFGRKVATAALAAYFDKERKD